MSCPISARRSMPPRYGPAREKSPGSAGMRRALFRQPRVATHLKFCGSPAILPPSSGRVAFIDVHIVDLHDRRIGGAVDRPARTEGEARQHHQRLCQFGWGRDAPGLMAVEIEDDPIRLDIDAVGVKIAV